MKTLLAILLIVALSATTAHAQIRGSGSAFRSSNRSLGALRVSPYAPQSLANPFGAGSPYRSNGLMNPYSRYGSPFSNQSWRNPYANNAPKLYSNGTYHGRLSTNPFAHDSTSNPYGPYGSPFSSKSVNNPYGAGSPYSTRPIHVLPSR